MVEDRVGAVVVAVFEERDVHQPEAVFEGDEGDPFPGRDGGCLGGGPDTGHQDLLSGVHGLEVLGVGGAYLPQQPVVVLHQMLRRVTTAAAEAVVGRS